MDATRFKCVARNEAGVDSISYTVDVNIPPVIDNVRNTEQIIIEGRVLRTASPVGQTHRPDKSAGQESVW